MSRRALHTRQRSVFASGLAVMSLCAACTTTLDPTLSVATGDASGAGAAGAAGAEGMEPMLPVITPQALSDCSMIAGTDHPYLACDHMRSFSEAVEDCKSGGAVLIKVESASENDLLKNVFPGKPWGWLGASRNDTFDWTCPDGTPFC